MASEDARSVLQDALAQMEPTGPSGFEGMIAQLLSNFTGKTFRLSRSGDQLGKDAVASTGEISVQCKRYTQSALTDNAVLGDYVAACSDSALEVWVLAATCRVSAQLADKLRAQANRECVEVLILDLQDEGCGPLGHLFAAYADEVIRWLSMACPGDRGVALQEVRRIFADIKARPTHQSSMDQLRQALRSTLLFPLLVQEELRARVELTCSGEVHFGRQRIDLSGAIRRSVLDELSKWYDEGARQPIITCGAEGLGKTWVALAFVKGLLDRDLDLVPVLVPSSDIGSKHWTEVVAAVLKRAADDRGAVRPIDFWDRKSRRLIESGRLVVLFDGLNQMQSLSAADFLADLSDDVRQWQASTPAPRIAMILTDRNPERWGPVRSAFRILPVGLYDDGELQDALALHGYKPDQVPARLENIIRRARYFELCLKHLGKMGNWEVVTPDILIYEEFKHKIENQPLALPKLSATSPQTAERTVAEIARKHLELFKSGAVASHMSLSRPSVKDTIAGYLEEECCVIEELASHGLLQEDKAANLAIPSDKLPVWLGIYFLFFTMEHEKKSDDDWERAITSLLDPVRDTDIVGRAIRVGALVCAQHHMVNNPVSSFRLLQLWLQLPNAPGKEDLAYVAEANTGMFLNLIEHLWERMWEPETQRIIGRILLRTLDGADHHGRELILGRFREWLLFHRNGIQMSEKREQWEEAVIKELEQEGIGLRPTKNNGLCRLSRLAQWTLAHTTGAAPKEKIDCWLIAASHLQIRNTVWEKSSELALQLGPTDEYAQALHERMSDALKQGHPRAVRVCLTLISILGDSRSGPLLASKWEAIQRVGNANVIPSSVLAYAARRCASPELAGALRALVVTPGKDDRERWGWGTFSLAAISLLHLRDQQGIELLRQHLDMRKGILKRGLLSAMLSSSLDEWAATLLDDRRRLNQLVDSWTSDSGPHVCRSPLPAKLLHYVVTNGPDPSKILGAVGTLCGGFDQADALPPGAADMAAVGEAAKQFFAANPLAVGVGFTQADHFWSQVGPFLAYYLPETAAEIWKAQVTTASTIPLTMPMRHAEHLATALSSDALGRFATSGLTFPGTECLRDNYLIAEAYRSWVRLINEESADTAAELYAQQHRDEELLDFVATALRMRAKEVDWRKFGNTVDGTTDKGELLRRVRVIAACSPTSSPAIGDDFAERYCSGDSELARAAVLALARSGDKRAFDVLDRQPDSEWKRFVSRYLAYNASFDTKKYSFGHLLRVLPLDVAGVALANNPQPEWIRVYCNTIEQELEAAESQYAPALDTSFQDDDGLQVLARYEPDRMKQWGLRIARSRVLGIRAGGFCNALLRVMIGLDTRLALQMVAGANSSYVGLVRYQSGAPLCLSLLSQSNAPEAQAYCTAALMSAHSDRDIFESVAASLEAHSTTIPDLCQRMTRGGTRVERAISARAMGWLGGASSRELLEHMRARDQSAWVREVSEQALETWWRTESAKQWYGRALVAASAMAMVGACEFAFRNADKLAFVWMKDIERDYGADKLPFKRKAIIVRMQEAFISEADKHMRELEGTFLGYTLRDLDLL